MYAAWIRQIFRRKLLKKGPGARRQRFPASSGMREYNGQHGTPLLPGTPFFFSKKECGKVIASSDIFRVLGQESADVAEVERDAN